MAENTPKSYRNLVIYEVYVRNHAPNGTFPEVEADLPRLKTMGVDVVWFMPIHPIGQLNKKGSLGCPYSIADYRAINPEYGSEKDFKQVIQTAHRLGMKVMIDVVYNHTSHDSLLVKNHPEWFHQDASGKPVTTVPAWSDVIDLKQPNPSLYAYLLESLQHWVSMGVDGFRCDVASIIPLDFWLRARKEIGKMNPDIIWLAESVHASFVSHRRSKGLYAISDGELYQAFDIEYDYDIWPIWQAAVTHHWSINRFVDMLLFQDCIYPHNYVKMRCVENHDQPRIMRLAPDRDQALAWTAFQAFNQGAFLIYAGQESGAYHTPSLFDVDKVGWGTYSLQPFLTRLAQMKKDPAQIMGQFIILESEPLLQAVWFYPEGESLYGVFNPAGSRQVFKTQLPDGRYEDLINDREVRIFHSRMEAPASCAILKVKLDGPPRPYSSQFFTFNFPPES